MEPYQGEVVLYRETAGKRPIVCIVSDVEPTELTYLGPTRTQDSLVHGQIIPSTGAEYLPQDTGQGHAFFSAEFPSLGIRSMDADIFGLQLDAPVLVEEYGRQVMVPKPTTLLDITAAGEDDGSQATTKPAGDIVPAPESEPHTPSGSDISPSLPEGEPAAEATPGVPAGGEAAPAELSDVEG